MPESSAEYFGLKKKKKKKINHLCRLQDKVTRLKRENDRLRSGLATSVANSTTTTSPPPSIPSNSDRTSESTPQAQVSGVGKTTVSMCSEGVVPEVMHGHIPTSIYEDRPMQCRLCKFLLVSRFRGRSVVGGGEGCLGSRLSPVSAKLRLEGGGTSLSENVLSNSPPSEERVGSREKVFGSYVTCPTHGCAWEWCVQFHLIVRLCPAMLRFFGVPQDVCRCLAET